MTADELHKSISFGGSSPKDATSERRELSRRLGPRSARAVGQPGLRVPWGPWTTAILTCLLGSVGVIGSGHDYATMQFNHRAW
jgi:hypothetical protein